MTTTPSERLRAILNERLPHLKAFTPGCQVNWGGITGKLAGFEITKGSWRMYNSSNNIPPNPEVLESGENVEILGHNASIYDIVRALGDEYAIKGNGEIIREKYFSLSEDFVWVNYDENGDTLPQIDPSKSAYDQDPAKIEEIIKLFN